VSTSLQPIVAELQALLVGAPDVKHVMVLLHAWAREHRYQQGSRDRVFIGPDAVVKIPLSIGTLEEVPEEFRPEQHVVWAGRGPARTGLTGWDQDLQVVVQPRYTVVDRATYDRLTTPTGLQLRYAVGHLDNKFDNWGLRPDGTPVLFDF
jgi:hypothetical protein